MESFWHPGDSTSTLITKRRSDTCRKPRKNAHLLLNGFVTLPSSSTPPSSDDSDKQCQHDGSHNSYWKDVNKVKAAVLKKSSRNGFERGGKPCDNQGKNYGSGCQQNRRPELKRCTDGATILDDRKRMSYVKNNSGRFPVSLNDYSGLEIAGDGFKSHQLEKSLNELADREPGKVKLKVGGTTHMLKAKSNIDEDCAVTSVMASSHKIKLIRQINSNKPVQVDISQGYEKPKKDTDARTDHSPAIRKSKRVVRKYATSEDRDDPSKIACLKKSKGTEFCEYDLSKNANTNIDQARSKKTLDILKKRKFGYDEDEDYGLYNNNKSRNGKKSATSDFESVGCFQDNEQASNISLVDRKIIKEPVHSSTDNKESSHMTRRRALQSFGEGDIGNGAAAIEFPNGLPSPPRKQKVQLSEVERQLKKAEAAQRRRIQLEKAAKESEAEAIRKILGHDSGKKKREEMLRQKHQKSQGNETNSSTLAPNCVRWVIGPTGTTVIFPEDAELPSIFKTKPHSYPPPREKCAIQSCSNPYKYRDSKTNLPLCSLQCYLAAQQDSRQLSIC